MADPLDTPLMWIPREKFSTLHAPSIAAASCAERKCSVHSSDWRARPGSRENLHRVRAEALISIREIAERRFDSPALVSGYVILDANGAPLPSTPRTCKDAVAWLPTQGLRAVQTCFIADVDTPGHVPWTPETLAAFEAVWTSAPSLRTCGLYLSRKGYRLLQPLATWLPVEEAEPRLLAWLHQLVAEGVWPSALECKDFGHLMRVPHFRDADGLRVISPRVDLSRLEAFEPPAGIVSPRRAQRRNARPLAADGVAVLPTFTDVVPSGWETVADALGAALRDTVRANWRRCYLALAGALATRGCPLEGVPAVIARAHLVDAGWEHLLSDRVEIARTTIVRWANGQELLGYGVLREEFPAVADALDATTTSGIEADVLAQLKSAPAVAVTPLAEAAQVLSREVEGAYGVTSIAGPPGLGKTRAVVRLAESKPPVGRPAAPGARIAVSVPTHRLAQQIVGNLPARSLRVFSPVSHTRPDGTPTCIYADAAKALASGGQSVEREFCEGRDREPCPERSRCPAYGGREGAEDASLVVGVHGLVRELRGFAGPAGTLVVDEPGETVFTERVTRDQLATAARYLGEFVPAFADAMAPALAAFTAWVEAAPADGELVYVHDAVRWHARELQGEILTAAGVDPETALEDLGEAVLVAAAGAISPKARTTAPPIRWSALAIARVNIARATELGEASRVLGLLWRAITRAVPYAAAVEGEEHDRCATVVGLNDELVLALKHEGPVVLLDANAALHVPAMAKVLGHPPKLVDLRVPDGAPIVRAVLATRATRKSWLPRGVPDWTAILPAIRAAVAWLVEDPSTASVGLIAPLVIEAAIAHAVDPSAPGPRAQWTSTGQSLRALERARALLAPALAPFGGRWVTGHYQALEGLDHMADCDATVTLMDPRPNLGTERLRAQYLGLDAEGRLDALAAAELEQAHGRLRTIHRTRPGRQLHVGGIVPGGWAGRPVEVRRLPVGRPQTVAAMGAEEFRAAREAAGMGLRELARALRVSDGTLRRYESGERAVPEAIAAALRALSPSAPETPLGEYFFKGVSGAPRAAAHGGAATGGFGRTPLQGVSGAPDDDPAGGGGGGRRRARRIDLGALLGGGGGGPGPVACAASNDTFPRAGGGGGGRW
ncbi:MAG: XRE family transcriptional regulator [Myxococcaceae bacterium]|nr:MAG: XRE family transcriptional regulator [Myxococcaceae bacterium]